MQVELVDFRAGACGCYVDVAGVLSSDGSPSQAWIEGSDGTRCGDQEQK